MIISWDFDLIISLVTMMLSGINCLKNFGLNYVFIILMILNIITIILSVKKPYGFSTLDGFLVRWKTQKRSKNVEKK